MQQPPFDKITKLLALAEGKGATPAEAANAASAAQALMERYRVTRATVEMSEDEPIVESAAIWRGGRQVSWIQLLADGLARIYDCRILIDRSPASMMVVGHESDVVVVGYLFTYLQREIERLGRIALKKAPAVGRGGRRRWVANFRVGAAATICRRLKERRASLREDQLATSGGEVSERAIVNLRGREAAVVGWVQQRYDEAARACALPTHDSDGLSHGFRAGSQVALRDALDAGTSPPLLPESHS